MTLSERIRDAMRRDGRSLYQLAIDSGVSRGQVVRFFNRQRELTLPAADLLCNALGLELRPTRRRTAKGG
jgi:transcriptional regulator with XRE-family HTH domain